MNRMDNCGIYLGEVSCRKPGACVQVEGRTTLRRLADEQNVYAGSSAEVSLFPCLTGLHRAALLVWPDLPDLVQAVAGARRPAPSLHCVNPYCA